MWLIPVLSCTSVRSLCRQNCCTTWKTWKKTASPSTCCLYWVTTFRPERSSRVRPKRHRGQFCCVNFNYMFHFLQNQTTTTSNFIVHSFLSLQESVSSVFVSFFPPPESVWKAGIWKPGKHWRFTWWGEKQQQQQQHVVVLVPQLLNNSCLCVRFAPQAALWSWPTWTWWRKWRVCQKLRGSYFVTYSSTPSTGSER